MATISVPYTFSAGTTIIAAEHNSNFSTIYNDHNGNISNTNIASGAAIDYSKLNLVGAIVNNDVSASAAIVDSKLATISTAGKVSAAAITNLASIGGGVLPLANGGTGQITAQAAIDILTAVAGGTSGKFWTNNGTNGSWGTVSDLPSYALSVKSGSLTRNTTDDSGDVAYTGVGFQPKAIIFFSSSAAAQNNISLGVTTGASSNYCIYLFSTTFSNTSTTYCIEIGSSTSNYNTGVLKSFDADGFTITWTKAGSPGANHVVAYLALL